MVPIGFCLLSKITMLSFGFFMAPISPSVEFRLATKVPVYVMAAVDEEVVLITSVVDCVVIPR